MLVKAVAETTGRNVAKIKADAANTGDLGIVAEVKIFCSLTNWKMFFDQ